MSQNDPTPSATPSGSSRSSSAVDVEWREVAGPAASEDPQAPRAPLRVRGYRVVRAAEGRGRSKRERHAERGLIPRERCAICERPAAGTVTALGVPVLLCRRCGVFSKLAFQLLWKG